jgi:hypothetical protein
MKLAKSSRTRTTAKPPWHQFRVGIPSDNPRWTESDCAPFDEVWHVTHIPNALTILDHGAIRPQLVYDESILNTRRTLVNWVSPNHWVRDYRYGNVAFNFDWYQFVKGKQYYWVESIGHYSPNACRILITDIDHDDDPELRRYKTFAAKPLLHDLEPTDFLQGLSLLHTYAQRLADLAAAAPLSRHPALHRRRPRPPRRHSPHNPLQSPLLVSQQLPIA